MDASDLPSPADLPPIELARILDVALHEDLAAGDVTTRAVVPPGAVARGEFVTREPMVLAGIGVAAAVFSRVDPRVRFVSLCPDGTHCEARAVVARVEGPAHGVLTGERVALNLLQRMCGVATRTRDFVRAVPPEATTRITDTRKTTPGLRALERYAVRLGGGINHRNDLGAGVLIKDNHIAVCGGVRPAIERARRYAPHTLRIECEVTTMAELDEALAARADVIMLDNFDDDEVALAMARLADVSPRPLIEVSGGVKLERIGALAKLGVDVISVGSLTHGARAVDIGLDVTVNGAWTT
ncbi:MAG: carboxylating nicotinate-nucleotide diphosphorylase [Polyangiales bacterium]